MFKNCCLLVLLLLSYFLQAQISTDSLSHALEKYESDFPQEKIYMHLDRPHYSPGDTIWFKAYITDAVAHLADTVSKNIYVDFYKKDTARQISFLLLRNESGFAHGQIILPDSIPEGVYEIRSYTNWMRNFSEALFFHKEVYIRKRYDSKIVPDEKEVASYHKLADLQFFPEGGNLVEGLQNRVAFKAVNKYGYGVDFEGFVLSNNKDTVAAIHSQHLGMGNFILKPKAGEKYFATFEKSSDSTKYYLPECLPQGYTFFIDNLTNKDKIKVTAHNNFTSKDRPILLVDQRGKEVAVLQSTSEGNYFVWTINKKDIPANGTVHFTLFNADRVPQCERLVYNDTHTPLSVNITSDQNEYKPREKVSLTLQVKNNKGEPVQGNFSLSVTDKNQAFTDEGDNIDTYFNLTSDMQSLDKEIKGYIEKPQYYFDRTNPMTSIDLDVLLMTQGWRRFVWRDVLAKQHWHTTHNIETGIDLKGKVLFLDKKIPKKPLDITLYYTDKGTSVYDKTQTGAAGVFVFKNIEALNGTKLLVQGSDKMRKYITIEVDSSRNNQAAYHGKVETFDPFFLNKQNVDHFTEQQLKFAQLDDEAKSTSTKILKEVVVNAKYDPKHEEFLKDFEDPRKTFYAGMTKQTVKVDQTTWGGAQNVLQMLQGRVSGLIISCRGTDCSVTTRLGRPAILVDGVMTEQAFLSSIIPSSVESIDIVTHPIGTIPGVGVISILTKRMNLNGKSEGTTNAVFKGYDAPREFYSPKYDIATPNKLPDYRATLYWNPNIKTDADGNAKVFFYNSDEKTSVNVQLEGISKEGQPATITTEYKID